MKIVRTSYFKNKQADLEWFYDWASRVQQFSGHVHHKLEIKTDLGSTLIWQTGNLNAEKTIVIFPGFRTSPLFWDLDKGLDFLMADFKIYLVETNGQPNPSDGNSPAIRSLDYGHWANQVLDSLKIDKTFVAGASFGGLVCMKLALVAPEKIEAAFLFNAGCLQNFSLSWKNISANLRPILFPSKKNVMRFLDTAVFCKPNHQLSTKAEELIVEYQMNVLTRYKDKTQKPYYMGSELKKVQVPTYLLEGDKDILFPFQKSIANAKEQISAFRDAFVFENVGHGIETHRPALEKLKKLVLEIS
jgi:pimeloyl-ACP methyl ester carboxylesterase